MLSKKLVIARKIYPQPMLCNYIKPVVGDRHELNVYAKSSIVANHYLTRNEGTGRYRRICELLCGAEGGKNGKQVNS